MTNKFLIGDMAKIHNVSTQTLRYYDKIGLLKPKIVDQDNGYRYYTIEQFEQLNTIKYLKFLGMSLNDIKEHLNKRDIKNIMKLLDKQKSLTRKKIQELELIEDKLESKINSIEDCINIEKYETVRIREMFERNIAFEYIKDSDSIVEFELCLKNLQNLFKDNYLMFTGEIGVIVSEDNLNMNRFDKYTAVCILIEDKLKYSNVKKLPAGKYACIYYKGPYKESYKAYEKLLKYLSDNNYEIVGDALEIGLIDCSVVLNEDEYLTEIQIPIK
ncbi:MerR family transcriptional regulator [Clostridium ganghwense]|uniref:MerR family transcriptional regulator n=1 Tax=Clostridium ganghwense TaxID=312089 RepID=A0ABT4CPD1_9CLOT|nr:MerR family transcriptional regulator [Clostridium ganghwense]MCY6369931.1 MerR family transcriptional regulator [Clostridium ganghwense]